MNPKDLLEEYTEQDTQVTEFIYTQAAKAQYESDLDFAKLQEIVASLKRQQKEKEAMQLNMMKNRVKEAYKSGTITRGQAAVNLQSIGMEELDICSLLEKWDGNRR